MNSEQNMVRTLTKDALLRKPWEYREVYRRGKRLNGQRFSLIYVPGTDSTSRLGISVHGVKRATERNRIKRIIREFFRQNREIFSPTIDVVFAVRPGFKPKTPAEVKDAVLSLVIKRFGAESFCTTGNKEMNIR